METWL